MKTKISRILGVSLTAVLLVSLMMFAVPTPVSANPGNVAWEPLTIPSTPGPTNILSAASVIGPMAYQPLDGSIYAYDNTNFGTTRVLLFKSTNGGHNFAPCGLVITPAAAIIAIVPSPSDANVVYVATTTNIYKSVDGGVSFVTSAAAPTLPGPIVQPIASMDVVYYAGRYILIVGTGIGATADVWTLDESAPFFPWQNLGFNAAMAAFYPLCPALDIVPAVAFVPDQSAGLAMAAVGSDNAAAGSTCVAIKVGGAAWGGTWGSPDILVAPGNDTIVATATFADIAFPDGFTLATASGFYFGINDTIVVNGGVYAFTLVPSPGNSLLSALLVGPNICSLDTVGTFFTGPILGGTTASGTVRSLDGGFSWPPSAKVVVPALLASNTYVAMNADFSQAWALVQGAAPTDEACVSTTLDSGTSWNGIGLIKTTIAAIQDLTFAPSGTIFMSTVDAGPHDSIWRWDGTFWERVSNTLSYGLPAPLAGPLYPGGFVGFDRCELTPTGDALFLGNRGANGIYTIKSTTNGQTYTLLPTPIGGSIGAANPITNDWVIINSTTVMTGSAAVAPNEVVCLTINNGLTWSEPVLGAGAGNSVSFDVAGTSYLVGDSLGNVFRSDNAGVTFTAMGATGLAAGNTFVAFDGTNPAVMYATGTRAGAGLGIFRKFSPAPPDPWVAIDNQGQQNVGALQEYPLGAGNGVGIQTSANGALYVADATAVGAVNPGIDGGLRRALDPQALPVLPVASGNPQPYWETGNETPTGVLANAFVFADLFAAGGNLWTYCNIAGPTTFGVWFYTDTLDASPSLSIGTVTTNTATFAWDVVASGSAATAGWSSLLGATDYQLQVNSRADFNAATFMSTIVFFPDTTGAVGRVVGGVVGGDSAAQAIALAPGTTYYARVRVGAEFGVVIAGAIDTWGNGAPVRSRWSNTLNFATPLGEATPPVPLVPLPGAMGVSVTPTFDWDPVPGAASYDIVVATDEGFTAVVASGSAATDACAWAVLSATSLDYGTQYYWSIQPIDGAGIPSGNEVISIFTTEAGPPATVYTCGTCGLQFSSEAALEAHFAAEHAAAAAETPIYIWVVIAIGAVLVIAVVVLIARTRGAA